MPHPKIKRVVFCCVYQKFKQNLRKRPITFGQTDTLSFSELRPERLREPENRTRAKQRIRCAKKNCGTNNFLPWQTREIDTANTSVTSKLQGCWALVQRV